MTLVADATKASGPPRVLDCRADDPSDFARIAQRGVAAVIWRREAEPRFARWLEALDVAALPRLRVICPPAVAADALAKACALADAPPGRCRDMLAGDMAALTAIAAELSGAAMLDVRVGAGTPDDASPLGVSVARLRLVCVYRGSGTVVETGEGGCVAGPRATGPCATGPCDVVVARGARWPGVDAAPPALRWGPKTQGARFSLVVEPVEPPSPLN